MSIEANPELLELAARVELCLFDVDGVLTDGTIFLGPNGAEFKGFNVKDGQGLVMLREVLEIGVITGRKSQVVSERMAQLGIKHVFQGQKNKLTTYEMLLAKLKLDPAVVCYVGDDLPDLAVMSRVGLPIAVADAHHTVREMARATTTKAGGCGAVREVCDLLLMARGKLDEFVSRAKARCIASDQNV